MKISNDMDLAALARRMGNPATEDEARVLREMLVAVLDGCDTGDLDMGAWRSLVGLAIDRHAEQCGEY